MPAVVIQDIRDQFQVGKQIKDDQLQTCLDDGIDTVKSKIGIEAYNQIFAGVASTVEDSEYLDQNTTATDEDALRTSRVTRSVIYYTMADLVLNTSLRIRPSGIVKKEQDSGSPAVSASSQVINEYLSPTEAKQYSDWLIGKADSAVGPYVIEQEPVNPWGAVSKIVRA